MAQDPNVEPRPSVWQRILSAWPIITFSVALAFGAATGYIDIRMAQAENANMATGNKTAIEKLTDLVNSKATKFLTDNEFDRLWEDLKEQSGSIEKLNDRINALGLQDERVNAKIELEIEKLRAEIQRGQAEQQRAMQEQTTVMQQILREVQSNN